MMRIAGFEKHSMVDYPGKLSAVVFTPGCNMDCYYCHNRQLLHPADKDVVYSLEDVMDFLSHRQGWLDGVVVTGGEPTLQGDLAGFCESLKALGYAVKLDTNGTAPWMVRELIDRGLVDYVAMDIKATLKKYEQVTNVSVDAEAIEATIDLLLEGQVAYEFRTTYAPPLSPRDVLDIAARIRGASLYAIQQYRTPGLGVNLLGLVEPPQPRPANELYQAARLAGQFVHQCIVRGADLPQNTIGEYLATPPQPTTTTTAPV
jgi:pyruvate formate lyase activating enzyme